MKYKSKIDWWFYLVAVGFAGVWVMLIVQGFVTGLLVLKFMAVLFLVIFFLMILPVVLRTEYTLEEETLWIRCGLLCTLRLRYDEILSMEETRNPISSAAPSLDRIELTYRTRSSSDIVLISPKLKHEFMEALLERNPEIAVIGKK